MTSTIQPVPISPTLMAGLWNVAGSSVPLLVGTVKKFSKPKVDAFGHRVVTAAVGYGDSILSCVLNDDGSLRAVAVKTPAGGDGAKSPLYLDVDLVYDNLVRALGLGDTSVVADLTGGESGDTTAIRTDINRAVIRAGYRFHLVTTPDGDWFVATPAGMQ